jgi:hypothetical protein
VHHLAYKTYFFLCLYLFVLFQIAFQGYYIPRMSQNIPTRLPKCGQQPSVVPMEITFMDNGGNIFLLFEFIDYIYSHII